MKSQWECLLENLGEWQGSFTLLSPQGELLQDTPTVVSLQLENDLMRQVVRRLPPDQPPEEKVLEYSSLGRGILFFDNGAFSQGSLQLSPFSTFGAELGLINGDRRLRLVQLFNKSGQLDKLTLIREKLVASTAEHPHLQVNDLVGEWRGEAVTLYPDWSSPDTYPTALRIEISGEQLHQHLTLYEGASQRHISSTARIEGHCLYFDTGPQPNQVLLLPDGASATSPQSLRVGQSFFLELGWLLQPNERQRIIRRYNDKGEWSSLTLVREQKTSE